MVSSLRFLQRFILSEMHFAFPLSFVSSRRLRLATIKILTRQLPLPSWHFLPLSPTHSSQHPVLAHHQVQLNSKNQCPDTLLSQFLPLSTLTSCFLKNAFQNHPLPFAFWIWSWLSLFFFWHQVSTPKFDTKRRLLYLKTQFVPCSKHFSSRL